MTRILPFTLFFLSSVFLWGQNLECEQTLNQASAEFEAGHFYSISGILKSCLDNGFSREQKVRAYLLLTQTYLVLNDQAAAEKSYLELLKADPEYMANPARDPIDVYYLSKKFTTTAVFTPNFLVGVNTSFPRTIYSLNTSSSPTSTNKIFKIGYQVRAAVDWNIDERWSLNVGLGYSKKSFKTIINDADAGTVRTFTEKEDWIDLPVLVKYSKDSGKLRPFAYAGFAVNILASAKLTAEETFATGPKTQDVAQASDVDITQKRNTWNRSLVLGGGIKYKVGKNFLFADVRYMAGLNNLAKNPYTKSGNQVDKSVFLYQYSSDFFRLDNFSISVGFIKPLYDPRKKKTAVKDLFQKLGLKRKRG